MRKMKDVCIFNPIEALGIVPSRDLAEVEEAGRIVDLWGPCPPHPKSLQGLSWPAG
jgi:hypothetical protein